MDLRFDVPNWGGSGAHWERVRAALLHERADRLPVTVWRHFPDFEDSAESLARMHLAFHMRFDLDLMVFTPRYAFTAEGWGYRPGDELDEYGRPVDDHRPFQGMNRWPDLSRAKVDEGSMGDSLDALRLTTRNLPEEMPVLLTVYAPATTAYFLRGDDIERDVAVDDEGPPTGFDEALPVIEQSIIEFCERGLEIADGLYVITYFAGHDVVRDEALAGQLMETDLSFLRGFVHRDKLLTLHVHGDDILFDQALEYPVDALSWHDRWVKPSLRDARIKSDVVLMGGINEADTIHRETPSAVRLQVEDAVSQVDGRGLILAPGGPVKVDTPMENIRAVVDSVSSLGRSS